MDSIKVGLITAAGAGTRMGFIGKTLPKALLPLYKKPIIHYILEHMSNVGIKKVYIIVSYKKEMVFEYVEEIKQELGLDIEYIYQKELKGIAHAISLARGKINEPFMVFLGDDCTLTDSFHKMINLFFNNKNAVVVEGAVDEHDRDVMRRTCNLHIKGAKLIRINEKPKEPDTNIRGCGVYLFSPKIFDYIDKTPVSDIRNEIEIAHSIQMAAEDGKAYVHMIEGQNININNFYDLLTAWNAMKVNSD